MVSVTGMRTTAPPSNASMSSMPSAREAASSSHITRTALGITESPSLPSRSPCSHRRDAGHTLVARPIVGRQTISMRGEMELYRPVHPVRFVTAASLFDGHDAAINIMRRILQSQGAEVIHLGHNRSAREVVDAVLDEDAQGVAISSYQGGHVEYFEYLARLLAERGAGHIRVYGGGGGTIVPAEIDYLH